MHYVPMKSVILENTHVLLHYQIDDYLVDILKRDELNQDMQIL